MWIWCQLSCHMTEWMTFFSLKSAKTFSKHPQKCASSKSDYPHL